MASEAAAPPVFPHRTWLVRWSPLGGLAWFAGTLLTFTLSGIGGDRGDTPDELRDWVDSLTTAEEAWLGAWLIFILLYPLLLGWFLGGLCVRLTVAGADAESVLALVGGTVFVVLLFLTDILVFAGTAELMHVEEAQQLDHARTVLALERIVWFVQAGGGIAAALMIVAASFGARRTGLVRRWQFWLSLVLGVVSLNTIGFVGVLAWFLWIALASLWMLLRDRGGPQSSSASNSS